MKKNLFAVFLLTFVLFVAGCSTTKTTIKDDNAGKDTTLYQITVGQVENGNLMLSTTSATEGTIITVYLMAEFGHELVIGSLKFNDTVIQNGMTFIMPKSNVVVSAKFKLSEAEKFDVLFIPRNDNDATTQQNLSVITEFPTFEKLGYEIEGWYTNTNFDTDKITLPYQVIEPLELYAKWELSEYDITYNNYEGVNAETNPSSYNINTKTIYLKAPTESTQLFASWYNNPEFEGEPISSVIKGSAGDLDLYAKYLDPREYTPGLMFTVHNNNQGVTVRRGTADITNGIIIPDYYAGVPVTTVNDFSIGAQGHMPFLQLPKYLKTIGETAFQATDMTGITVEIPDTVTGIYMGAFNGTNIGALIIGENSQLETIGSSAFASTQINYIYLPAKLKTVGSEAFRTGSKITIDISPLLTPQTVSKFSTNWTLAGWESYSPHAPFYHDLPYGYY